MRLDTDSETILALAKLLGKAEAILVEETREHEGECACASDMALLHVMATLAFVEQLGDST
jgi:hypothetical protein